MKHKLAGGVLVFVAAIAIYIWASCPDEHSSIHEVSATTNIDIKRERAWENLQDLSLAHHYVPGLVNTIMGEGPAKGVGATRRVYQTANRFINETVVDWQDGNGFTLRLHDDNGKAPFPFKQAWFVYALKDGVGQQTQAVLTLRYEMSGSCLGYFLHDLLVPAFESKTEAVAESLKVYYESG